MSPNIYRVAVTAIFREWESSYTVHDSQGCGTGHDIGECGAYRDQGQDAIEEASA